MSSDSVKQEEVLTELLKVRDRAVAFCYTLFRNFHTAEDIYQEASSIVIRHIDEYRDGSFNRWFWTILRNVVGTHIRSARRSPVVFSTEIIERLEARFREDPAPEPEAKQDYLIKCFSQLQGNMRRVLMWRFLENLSCGKIAKRLKRTTNAAYSIIKRARIAIRKCVERKMRAAGESE